MPIDRLHIGAPDVVAVVVDPPVVVDPTVVVDPPVVVLPVVVDMVDGGTVTSLLPQSPM